MESSRTLNSSESIARGAALWSAVQSGLFRAQPYYAVDLCCLGLKGRWMGQNESMENESNEITIVK
jgi:molecular chaperone DnaK (HSP70)